jgi:HD-GYP domain-containing protein (c-di-GMP phosphodiesterase class II)
VPAINRALREAEEKNYEIHLTRVLLDAMDNGISEKRGHSKRIAECSLLIACAINMSEDKKRRLYYASLLHDIGFLKIRIQDVISREEFKMHPQLAYEMLRQIHFYADIAPIVLHHHERYDGKGYPSGLKGEDIPLESRIIAIAEAFDAMVSKDSYKYIGKMINDDARPSVCEVGHAIEELKNNAGTQFDPQLVKEFANTVPEHLCP